MLHLQQSKSEARNFIAIWCLIIIAMNYISCASVICGQSEFQVANVRDMLVGVTLKLYLPPVALFL